MEKQSDNFLSFITSFVSISVIASLFSYKVLNSFLDNIFFPILDLFILPDKKFHKLTTVYDNKLNKDTTNNINNNNFKYAIRPGIFLKDFITWSFIIIILYIIYRVSN